MAFTQRAQAGPLSANFLHSQRFASQQKESLPAEPEEITVLTQSSVVKQQLKISVMATRLLEDHPLLVCQR
jgi:hypothetical protein